MAESFSLVIDAFQTQSLVKRQGEVAFLLEQALQGVKSGQLSAPLRDRSGAVVGKYSINAVDRK
jgi:hypothetical protein